MCVCVLGCSGVYVMEVRWGRGGNEHCWGGILLGWSGCWGVGLWGWRIVGVAGCWFGSIGWVWVVGVVGLVYCWVGRVGILLIVGFGLVGLGLIYSGAQLIGWP